MPVSRAIRIYSIKGVKEYFPLTQSFKQPPNKKRAAVFLQLLNNKHQNGSKLAFIFNYYGFYSNEDMLGKIFGRYRRLRLTENLYHTQCIQ